MNMIFDSEFYSKTNHILDFYMELTDTVHKQSLILPKGVIQINDKNAKSVIEPLLTTHVATLSGSLCFFAKAYFHKPLNTGFDQLIGTASNLLTMLRQILILTIDFCYLSKTNLHADYYSYKRPKGKWSDKNDIARLDQGMSYLLKHSQFASPIKDQSVFTKMTKTVFKLIDDYRYCNTLIETYCKTENMIEGMLILREKRNVTFVLMYIGFCLLSLYEFSSVINTNKLTEYWTTFSDYGEYATEVHKYYESLK